VNTIVGDVATTGEDADEASVSGMEALSVTASLNA